MKTTKPKPTPKEQKFARDVAAVIARLAREKKPVPAAAKPRAKRSPK